MCFKDNTPPCPEIILHLLSFLMVEAKPLPTIKGNPGAAVTDLILGGQDPLVARVFLRSSLIITN